jgi:hypothetical protein
MIRKLLLTAVALLALGRAPAQAAPIFPSTYDMLNGNGVASSGSFNYWDLSYSGLGGMTTIDNAPLSGGLGDLTDGIIATDNWLNVENLAGTGPYVGWRSGNSALAPNPTVTFRFAGPVNLESITIYVDDSGGAGGVSIPASVDIGYEGFGYTNFVLVDPDPSFAPVSFTFSGLALTGSSFDVRFNNGNEWVFVSEVAFDGSPTSVPVPEPATGLLLLSGIAAGAYRRRRRR